MITENMHIHSNYSHDGKSTVDEMCLSAINTKINCVAFTDHCDTFLSDNPLIKQKLDAAFNSYEKAKNDYADKLTILSGVEIGEIFFNNNFVTSLLSEHNYDVVLMSVHAVRYKQWQMPFSLIDFSDKDQNFIDAYMDTYFNDLLFSALNYDYDVLCHLTVPVRYICVKYNKKVDFGLYDKIIDEILATVIKRKKSLEINTSELKGNNPYFMPNEKIIDKYIELGGEKFTIGSDAHITDNISVGLIKAEKLLKAKGINSVTAFNNRMEHKLSL